MAGLGIGLWGIGAVNLRWGGIVFYLVLAGVPFLLYAVFFKSRLGTMLIGPALVGIVILTQAYVSSRAGSSTAALGYLYLPPGGFLVLLLGAPLEIRRVEREEASSERGQ